MGNFGQPVLIHVVKLSILKLDQIETDSWSKEGPDRI